MHTHARAQLLTSERFYKVLDLAEALTSAFARDAVLVRLTEDERDAGPALIRNGFAGLFVKDAHESLPCLYGSKDAGVIADGDVVRIDAAKGSVRVLYRRAARSNWLFATERCNSNCVMCSQPPREIDDSWRLGEMKALLPLIDRELPFLGITGGEPTLLGDGLVDLLDDCQRLLPKTHIHVLSNGRAFEADQVVAAYQGHADRLTWAIPLYSDISELHDKVVGSVGAFEQTVNGLYNLAERGFEIELRAVLHALTVPRLQALSEFICRNFPFVGHVAFMGLEPMGFAKRNMAELWVDPIDYSDVLESAVHWVNASRIRVSVYNLPLCILPPTVRPFARQSISDWKNTFPQACDKCSARADCSGFFASAGVAWLSRAISPIEMELQR